MNLELEKKSFLITLCFQRKQRRGHGKQIALSRNIASLTCDTFFEFMRLPTDLITQQKIISRNNTDDIKQDISEILEKNVFINTKLESKIEVILINIYNDL